MKAQLRQLLLVISLAAFSLLFLFQFNQGGGEKSVPQKQVLNSASLGPPVRLSIPKINVKANVQHVGVNSKGEMEVPTNVVDVGWFKIGSRPGENGSAVISGHLDGKDGNAGVFTNLHKLKKGDKLYVQDGKGASITFVVKESRIYEPGYAEEVFSLNDSAHLNLITCDGVWDGTTKSYNKRLVVFADLLR